MIDLVLIRHGESIRNYASKLAHQGDFSLLDAQLSDPNDYEPGWPLTELGIAQAQLAGEYLAEAVGPECDIAYVSPYLRTLQTARHLNLKNYFEPDWRLRERRWGDLTPDYTPEKYVADLKYACERDWRSGLPGGESVSDLMPHLRQFVAERVAPFDGNRFVIVTHGGAMKAMRLVLEGEADDGLPAGTIPNASVIHYRLESVGEDGRIVGEVEQIVPQVHGEPGEHWHHFG